MRIRLKKSYHHKLKRKVWPVGTVLQVTPQLAGELFAEKIAEPYNGDYPPKEKMKMDLSTLKQK